jgi:hypothetical protein
VTQQVAPDSDAWELQKDIYKKLGWVRYLTISCIPFADWSYRLVKWNQCIV